VAIVFPLRGWVVGGVRGRGDSSVAGWAQGALGCAPCGNGQARGDERPVGGGAQGVGGGHGPGRRGPSSARQQRGVRGPGGWGVSGGLGTSPRRAGEGMAPTPSAPYDGGRALRGCWDGALARGLCRSGWRCGYRRAQGNGLSWALGNGARRDRAGGALVPCSPMPIWVVSGVRDRATSCGSRRGVEGAGPRAALILRRARVYGRLWCALGDGRGRGRGSGAGPSGGVVGPVCGWGVAGFHGVGGFRPNSGFSAKSAFSPLFRK